MDVSPVGIRVHGLKRLKRVAKHAGDTSLPEEVKRANLEGAEIVEREARPNITILSGRLRRTLKSGATQRAGWVGLGGGRIAYAGVVHFGWPARNIRPQPWLYDAIDRRAEEVMDRYLAAVDRALAPFSNPGASD